MGRVEIKILNKFRDAFMGMGCHRVETSKFKGRMPKVEKGEE